jgi:hypothetical protein
MLTQEATILTVSLLPADTLTIGDGTVTASNPTEAGRPALWPSAGEAVTKATKMPLASSLLPFLSHFRGSAGSRGGGQEGTLPPHLLTSS